MLEEDSATKASVKPKDASPDCTEATTEQPKRPFVLGLLKGRRWIADDFDAPLPDELHAEFEGRNDHHES